MLKLESVEFQYDPKAELYRFSMQLKAGSIACISGRSGSGKSTLLDLIAGFQIPSSGTIWWNDTNLTRLPPEQRPVTTVFQRNNLFEHRNALDNVLVGINPKLPKQGPDVESALQALSAVGLADFRNTVVNKLSGGQQQRVAIARAVVRQSSVVMMDEPFSALDQQTKQEAISVVQKLAHEHNRAIILVTHDLRDCEALADKHYVIEHGLLNKAY